LVVEVVLEPEGVDADAARLAEEKGLELTETRRDEDGALLATMRPAAGDAEAARRTARDLAEEPGVRGAQVKEGSSETGPTTGAAPDGVDPDLAGLAELELDDLPPVAVAPTGLPLKAILGMLAVVGLLTASGLLFWSAHQDNQRPE
jgi:hypothetical protein